MTIATEDTTSGWNFTMRQRRKKRFLGGGIHTPLPLLPLCESTVTFCRRAFVVILKLSFYSEFRQFISTRLVPLH